MPIHTRVLFFQALVVYSHQFKDLNLRVQKHIATCARSIDIYIARCRATSRACADFPVRGGNFLSLARATYSHLRLRLHHRARGSKTLYYLRAGARPGFSPPIQLIFFSASLSLSLSLARIPFFVCIARAGVYSRFCPFGRLFASHRRARA